MRILMLALCIMIYATSPALAQRPGGPAKPTPVFAAPVEQKRFSDKVEALGTLRANESVEITSAVTEFVTTIHFEDNQSVKQGDVLIEMDASEELAALAEQDSIMQEAQRQVDRLEPLVKKGAASESILDENRRELLAAKARADAIRSRIDKRIIKAPYDGVMGLRKISVGALTQPGTLITTLDDVSIMKLDFSVPEVFLSSLKTGVAIIAKSEAYPDEEFTGQISGVDSRIDPITRSIQARALIDNAQGLLKPGLLMKVELSKSPRQTLVIPEEALISEGSDHFVLEVVEGEEGATAERRQVTIGTRQFGEAEILSGLQAGALVVTHGSLRARPGSKVTVNAIEKDNETLGALLGQKDQAREGE